MSEQETVLLIGAAGFIGSHLRAAIEAEGTHVIGASRSCPEPDPAAERLEPEATDLYCDLDDGGSIERTLAIVRPDRIVNAGGPPSVARSWKQPAATARLHALGTLNLLEAIRRHAPQAHLTCISSAEIYGSSEGPMSEQDPPAPITPYGAAKAAMEVFCGQYVRAHGIRVAVVRPFNQIGPGLARGHAIADFAAAVAAAERAGETARLPIGNPDAIRDYTDVRDAAQALRAISQQGVEGTYNLCSGRPVSTDRLIATLAAAATVPVVGEHDASLARPADPQAKVGAPDRLAEAIGWRADTPLERTVADILAAARAAPGPSLEIDCRPE